MVLELPLLGDLITKPVLFLFSVLVASVVAVLWRKICGLLVHLLRIRAQQGCFPLWMTSLSLYISSSTCFEFAMLSPLDDLSISLYIFHLHPPPTCSACSADWFSACLDLFRLISSHIILFILPAEHYSFYQPNNPNL